MLLIYCSLLYDFRFTDNLQSSCVHMPYPNAPTSSSVRAKPTLTARIRALTPHENIYTVPNILTFSRLLAAPLIGYLVLHDHHSWAIGLFAYAGITDLVDGWIARRWKLQTVVGTVIDPMADKILMTVLVGCLAWKGAMPGGYHVPTSLMTLDVITTLLHCVSLI